MKLLTITLLLFCSMYSYGQQLISEASRVPTIDEFGDPLNNILDHNGARQGAWYYDGYDGELLLIEEYTDNILMSRQLALESNESQSLLDQNQWAFIEGASLGLEASALGYASQTDKQLGVIVDHSGLIKLTFLGNWSTQELPQVTAAAEQWFATHGISFNQNYEYALILIQ